MGGWKQKKEVAFPDRRITSVAFKLGKYLKQVRLDTRDTSIWNKFYLKQVRLDTRDTSIYSEKVMSFQISRTSDLER